VPPAIPGALWKLVARWRGKILTVRSVNTCHISGHYGRSLAVRRLRAAREVGSGALWHVCTPKDLLQRTQRKETRPRKRMTAPLRGIGEFFVVRVRPNQDEIEMEAWRQGAWAQPRGAWCLPGWKGEVVHPGHAGAPGSQCVYRIRFLPDPVSALTLRNT
jgi:hypothetical protein